MVLSCQGKLDIDRWIGDIGVIDFRVSNSGGTPWTPVDHPVTPFEHPLFVSAGKCPPCSLDIFRLHCLVGIGKIKPDAKRFELPAHHFHVGSGKSPAFLDKVPDSELLDIFF